MLFESVTFRRDKQNPALVMFKVPVTEAQILLSSCLATRAIRCDFMLLPDEADAELDRPRSLPAPGLRAALLPLLRNNGAK